MHPPSTGIAPGTLTHNADPRYTRIDIEGPGECQLRGLSTCHQCGCIDMKTDEFIDDSFVYGDTNCNGSRGSLDIDALVLTLTDPTAYAVTFPSCYIEAGDCNADGSIDSLDIDPFVDLQTDG